tara:strand:- start:431 stop:1255 length:825 start_codon:yes stop_codon:yes gene_type:complete
MFKEKPIIIAAYIICTAVAILVIIPFLWVLMTSLKPAPEISIWPPEFLPRNPTLAHFTKIIVDEGFLRFIFNSFVIAVFSMVSILVTSSLAGFIFAKYEFPTKGILFTLILMSCIIPIEVYMIPLYLMIFDLKLLNTYTALISPFVIMTFGVFFMRQTIISIPDELLEAARMDGASEFWIYLRIVLYLSKSALMALGVFSFSEAWANFIWPLVVVSSKDMYTTELGLATYQRQFFIEYGPISAGAVITIIPMLIVFFLLRRHIMKGIATSGLKG